MPLYRVYMTGPDGFETSDVYQQDSQVDASDGESAIQSVIDKEFGTDVTSSELRDEMGSYFRAYPISSETERRLGVALIK